MDAGLTSGRRQRYESLGKTPRVAARTSPVGLAAMCLGVALTGLTLGGAGGCSALTPQPRTTVTPPRTTAGHAVTSQSPGITTTLSITVDPPGLAAPDAPATTPRRKAAPLLADDPAKTQPAGSLDPADAIRAAAELAERTGNRVRVEYSQTVPVTTSTTESTLDDRGAGLDSRGEGQATGLDQAGRRVSLPWDRSARASGGGFGLTTEIAGLGGINVLHVLGGLCVIAALIPIVLPPRRIGLAASIAGTGLLLIAAGTVADEYPWIYAIAIVAFLGVLGWLAYAAWREARKSATLAAIVPAVENVENSDAVKAGVTQEAGGAIDLVRAEVRAIKKRLGL